MACCCGTSNGYNPLTATPADFIKVTVPEGCSPGDTIQIIAPNSTTDNDGRVSNITIPEGKTAGSSFLIRFSKQELHEQKVKNIPPSQSTQIEGASIVDPTEVLTICVQAPSGARIGSIMYAPVPGDKDRVLPVRIPRKRVGRFYVEYTLDQTILRSDIPHDPMSTSGSCSNRTNVPGNEKQNWHDNPVAVVAPVFFF